MAHSVNCAASYTRDMPKSRQIKLFELDLLEPRERFLLACLSWVIVLLTLYEGVPFVLGLLNR